MSRNKRPNAADPYYNNYRSGGRSYAPNLGNNRRAILERMYVRILTELASNRFKWSGLPATIDVRYLELTLFRRAQAVFYFDTDYNAYFALAGGGNGPVNMVDRPTSFLITGMGRFRSKTVSAKKAVGIYANYLRQPDTDIVGIYASKLADIDLTIEINARNARRNKVIMSAENQRLSASNIARQLEEGNNAIQVGGAVQDLEFISAIDLGIPHEVHEKMHILRTRLWNECMGLLGIENANQDKKERLVAAEVGANDDQTSMMRYVNLNARRQACDEINARYGELNVSVEYNTDVDRRAAQMFETSSDESEV